MKTQRRIPLVVSGMAVAVSLVFAQPALANPTGAQVVNGQVSISRPNASTLNITNSPGAIINWQGFSIGANEVTRFIQQSASSAVLNRVVGPDISAIQGQLLSNGRVFLVNPAGIVIGPNAMIDTAGFVGSALNMSNADFLAGKLRFNGEAGAGHILNQGVISAAAGGQVILVGPHIENSGLITAPGGEIILAAGQSVTIASLADEGVQFKVQAPADSVVNVGKLAAQGGAVGVFAGTLKHSGDIRASSLTRDAGGNIVLKASGDITLAAGSSLNADGASGGAITVQSSAGTTLASGAVSAQGSEGKGGDIRVLGNRVGVLDSAVIDASGERGGGQVLIGGDFLGANANVQNAARTFTGADTVMRADAKSAGDGGKVIVWSDEVTRVNGVMSARGGTVSGNGGLIETSGKLNLHVGDSSRVDLRAPRGQAGQWLLDPKNITVQTAGATAGTTDVDQFADFPASDSIISPATLGAATGFVQLQASNDIVFVDPVTLGANVGLFATAGRSILVNNNITGSNSFLQFFANSSGATAANRDAGAAAFTMAPGTTITATNGTVQIRMLPGVTGATSGNITLANINANNVSVLHDGPTPNGSILRQTGNPLLTVANTSNVHLEIETAAGGASSSIGTAANPITVTTGAGGTAKLESHYHGGGAGIFVDALTNLQVGGATTVFSGNVKGVQTITTAGAAGPIRLTAVGNLTQLTGSAVCGGLGGTGGPICAGAAGSTNAADVLTMRAADMNLGMTVAGNSVILLPQVGGEIGLIGGAGALTLSALDFALFNTTALRIGERSGVGTDTSSSGNLNFGGQFTAPGAAALEFRVGGNIATSGGVTDIATTNANIALNAGGVIGATGAGRLKVNPGTGLVTMTAGNNIFIEQSSGDMTLENFSVNFSGPAIELATTNGNMSGKFSSTGNGNWSLITQGAAKDIALTGNATVQAASLTLTPTGSVAISGTRIFNTPLTTTRPLVIGSGDVTFNNAIAGANLTLNGGNVTVGSASTFNVLTLGASAGTATLNANTSFANGALIQGGTVAGSGALTINNGLTLQNGTLGGTGAITINTNPLAWSGGTISNTAGITANGGVHVTGGTPTLTGKLTSGALTMTAGTLGMNAGSTFNLTGTSPGTFSGGTINDAGTLQFTGAGGGLSMSNAAALNVNTGGVLDFAANNTSLLAGTGTPTLANSGTVRKSAGAGTSQINVALTNNAGATLDVQQGILQAGSFSTNSGTITIAANTQFAASGSDLTNAGTINLKGTQGIAPDTNTQLSTGNKNLINNGTILGVGQINLGAGQTLTNNATVAPGASPGILAILGNYTQAGAGVLSMQLGGTTAGTGYDQLQVNGNVNLGGTVHATSIFGFTPAVGNVFNLVTATGTLNSTASLNNGLTGVSFGVNAVSSPPSSFYQLSVSSVSASSSSSSSSSSPSATDTVTNDLQRIRQTIPDDDGENPAPKRPFVAPQCT